MESRLAFNCMYCGNKWIVAGLAPAFTKEPRPCPACHKGNYYAEVLLNDERK